MSTLKEKLAKQHSTRLPQLKLYHTELGWNINEAQTWAIRNNYFQTSSSNTFSLLKKVDGAWRDLLEGTRKEVIKALQQRTHKKPVFSNLQHPKID